VVSIFVERLTSDIAYRHLDIPRDARTDCSGAAWVEGRPWLPARYPSHTPYHPSFRHARYDARISV